MTHLSSDDPPFEPLDADVWYESAGAEISDNVDLAVLIVRLGIASNALAAHQLAGVRAIENAPAQRMRGLINAMITASAYTWESVQLGREHLRTLRPLAQRVKVSEDVLHDFGQLGADKHPASEMLDRARNKIGFHWDDDVIRRSTLEFERNETIIWTEFDKDFQPLHRLAHEVVVHAFLPADLTALLDSDVETARVHLEQQLDLIGQAMNTVTTFFAAAIVGYFDLRRSTIHRREAD